MVLKIILIQLNKCSTVSVQYYNTNNEVLLVYFVCRTVKVICCLTSDANGYDMTARQDTPTASEKTDACVVFNVDVHVQKTVQSLPPGQHLFVVNQFRALFKKKINM